MMALKGLIQRLLGLRHSQRRRIVVLADVIWLWVATYLTLAIADVSLYQIPVVKLALVIVIYIVVTQVLFSLFRVYRAIIRHLDLAVIATTMAALLITASLLSFLLVLFIGNIGAPIQFLAIQAFTSISGIVGYRLALYLWLGRDIDRSNDRKPIGIFGTHRTAQQFAAAQLAAKQYKPAFFLTEEETFAGGMINGIRVYHLSQLDWAVRRFSPAFIVFCCEEEEFRGQSAIVNSMLDRDIPVRLNSASSSEFRDSHAALNSRRVQIEDLIGRSRNPIDHDLLEKSVSGQRVLVTGGAGSIGRSLCERIAGLEPEKLVVLDHDEKALTAFRRDMGSDAGDIEWKLINICDEAAIAALFESTNFDIVFHAAAYKHVDLGEETAAAVISNNILGTANLARSAMENGAKGFVLISSDKAVEPASVMGASKRWCEEYMRMMAAAFPQGRFCSVRFGNVIESSGSVIPLFKKQISQGGPVTVTDKRMKRYFMALEEAVDLILQSASLARGGETFILKMGDPIRIMDIAQTLIKLAGHTIRRSGETRGEIEILETGLRAGEKISESLFAGNEEVEASPHEAILVSRRIAPTQNIMAKSLQRLAGSLETGDQAKLKAILMEALEEIEDHATNSMAENPPRRAAQ